MTTFAEDLEEAAGDEPIKKAVIGEMGWPNYNEEGKEVPERLKGKVLSWDEARPLLDYEYSRGYGAPECHAVYGWTETRVLFVVQYDGLTAIHSIPRKPKAGLPEMPGG